MTCCLLLLLLLKLHAIGIMLILLRLLSVQVRYSTFVQHFLPSDLSHALYYLSLALCSALNYPVLYCPVLFCFLLFRSLLFCLDLLHSNNLFSTQHYFTTHLKLDLKNLRLEFCGMLISLKCILYLKD